MRVNKVTKFSKGESRTLIWNIYTLGDVRAFIYLTGKQMRPRDSSLNIRGLSVVGATEELVIKD